MAAWTRVMAVAGRVRSREGEEYPEYIWGFSNELDMEREKREISGVSKAYV